VEASIPVHLRLEAHFIVLMISELEAHFEGEGVSNPRVFPGQCLPRSVREVSARGGGGGGGDDAARQPPPPAPPPRALHLSFLSPPIS